MSHHYEQNNYCDNQQQSPATSSGLARGSGIASGTLGTGILSDPIKAKEFLEKSIKDAAIRENLPSVFETTAQGGRHSRVDEAFELLPAAALEIVCKVLGEGASKYEKVELHNSLAANWRKIPRHLHIRHAGMHLLAVLRGKDVQENLSHAACRLLFALETE